MLISIVGVDPGLVHTGCVKLDFDVRQRIIERQFVVIDGLEIRELAGWVRLNDTHVDHVFVEKYRPRHNFSQDPEMLKAEGEIKRLLPKAELVSNTGIMKAVPLPLLQLLGLRDFPVGTHHQDLRSAARILVKGMMKKPGLNKLLASVVTDALDGNGWEMRDWND